MSSPKVALVTGANKGIGLSIIKSLCKQFNGIVYLTARSKTNGEEAVDKLKEMGLTPKYHLLDINNKNSIDELYTYLLSNYGGLDILVNNAAIAYPRDSTVPHSEQVENTIKTNYFGTLNVCEKLFPLLNPHSRVVNVSSMLGQLSKLPGANLKAKFASDSLTKTELNDLMKQYIDDCKSGVYEKNGWPRSSYNMSKIGLNALTFIYQREFNNDARPDLVINAVHPGYIGTDLTSFKGPGTPDEGAEAPVYAALLPPNIDEPKGDFVWNDKTIHSWLG